MALGSLILVVIGGVSGALLVFGWMIDETHFDRPSAEFDILETEIKSLTGVGNVDKERWVEAPAFSRPTSWMSVTVTEAGAPALLEAACSTAYRDPVSWSVHIETSMGAEVSVHADPTDPNASEREGRCPDFGFDAVRLAAALDRVAPGLSVQPAKWENDRFALVVLDEVMPAGFTEVLPLVEHAGDLIVAAGLPSDTDVEINTMNLGFVLQSDESDRYVALLTELAERHEVSSYWADSGGTPIDGIEKVQVVAPPGHEEAIEDLIRSSRLHIADLPVRFIEQ
ncbi:hypothetical protein [Microbacterium sp. P05]|uniref:hypothetical protein n=1 Tax=Microbacterium sp. P05 TaxID=3366948 RepID=UPI003746289A